MWIVTLNVKKMHAIYVNHIPFYGVCTIIFCIGMYTGLLVRNIRLVEYEIPIYLSMAKHDIL